MIVLAIMLSAVSIVANSARPYRVSNSKNDAIAFSVPFQQFYITDKVFNIAFTLESGNPDQIRFVPSADALAGGLNAQTEWTELNIESQSSISVERPYGIKAGMYECSLIMRSSDAPDDSVAMPFVLSVLQIEFDINRSLISCGDEATVRVEIRDIEGNPNSIKLLVNGIDKNVLCETPWQPFNVEEPYLDIDLSGVPQGTTIVSDDEKWVQIGLADSTTRDTTTTMTYVPIYQQNDSIVVDSTQIIRTIKAGDVLSEETITEDVIKYVVGADTFLIMPEDSVYDALIIDTETYTVTVYAENDTTIYKIDTIALAGDIIGYDTIASQNSFGGWQAHRFTQIGRGMGEQYIGTKFNGCMVFVDNSGRIANSPVFVTYQWYKDGELIEGATNQYYFEKDESGNMKPLNGTFSVTATTAEGNVSTLCPVSLYASSNAPIRRSSIIYPNPTDKGQSATLHIFYRQEELEEAVLRVYDLLGNLAYIMVGLGEYNALPILPTNEYIVLIETPDYTETVKFIVK